LEFDEVPKILFGDENRLTYILTCLLKNAFERNKKVGALKEVDVFIYTSPEQLIEFRDSDSYEVIVEILDQGLQITNLVVIITDFGPSLTSNQIANEMSILKRVIKAMGGKLEVKSIYTETNFIFSIPC